jgi:hypothetical protein
MKKRTGITLIEVIVLIIVILFVIVILSASFLQQVRKRAIRVICGTNLKGLGTAFMIYSNDYDDNYPQLPGKGPWSKRLGFDYYMTKPNFTPGGAEEYNSRTITASWYLLVREVDVNPKSLVCPYSSQTEFDGSNPVGKDLVKLWDFGNNPYKHVSYAMHNPYGRFPADAMSSASFAIAADMNPWFKDGDIVSPSPGANSENWLTSVNLLAPYWLEMHVEKYRINWANAYPHNRAGQEVLYGDGHSEWDKTSDVGVKHDNIYTFWPKEKDPTADDIRIGKNPTARDKENDSKSKDDSFLAI